MGYYKYMGVDVLSFLEERMLKHVQHYRSDFEIDKGIIQKAAESGRAEDKNLLWMARKNGTWCHKEREVFIRGSGANRVWMNYADQKDEVSSAYGVEITGIENGAVRGNVYELDYMALVGDITSKAVAAKEIEKMFADGYVDQVPIERSKSPYYRLLIAEHGDIVNSRTISHDDERIDDVLSEQRRVRGKLREAPVHWQKKVSIEAQIAAATKEQKARGAKDIGRELAAIR